VHLVGFYSILYLNRVLELLIGRHDELQKLDRKTRKLLTIRKQHHPKAAVDRLYVPRKQGGSGQMQLEEAYAVKITRLVEHVDRKKDRLI
jgi:hypothetical protein